MTGTEEGAGAPPEQGSAKVLVRSTPEQLALELLELRGEVLRFETVVGEISAQLVSGSVEELDESVTSALLRLGGFCGASATFVLRFSPDQRLFGMTHLWSEGRLLVDRQDMQNLPLGALSWWSERLLSGDELIVGSLGDLPPEASVERSLFGAQGVRSMVSVPLILDGKVIGALGSYFTIDGRRSKQAELSLHRVVAQLLSGIFRRKQVEGALRSSEEQLIQAQRMEAIGRLAGGVAHDFNNLLTGILGYADEALLRLTPEDPTREEIEEIARAAERAADLTKQLLAFSRKQIGQPRVIAPGEVVAEAHRLLRRVIGEDVELSFTRSEEPWQIAIDPGQLHQILMNLATNARDAMPRGGRISISTSRFHCSEQSGQLHGAMRAGDYVVISVSDEGMGIRPELLSQIFEPFFTTKPPGKGTGLGLSTVYGLVKQNDGMVEVTSEIGVGTTFNLFFPRVRAPSDETPVPTPVERRGGGAETVLLVEDDSMVRALARRVLERNGYQVVEAGSGEEALAIVEREGLLFDLLLSDVVMPGMNGPELFERLLRDRPRLACLFMSGYAEDVIVHHGMTEPGRHLLSKPFSAEKLSQAVRGVLDEVDS